MSWPEDFKKRTMSPAVGGQQLWVPEMSPLTRNWNQRMGKWKQRFARPTNVERHARGSWW